MNLQFQGAGGGDVAGFLMRGVRTEGEDAVVVDAADGVTTLAPIEVSGIFDCTLVGGCDAITLRLTFTGTGGGDAYVFALRGELFEPIIDTPVSVPSTIALSFLGVMGVLRLRRRT